MRLDQNIEVRGQAFNMVYACLMYPFLEMWQFFPEQLFSEADDTHDVLAPGSESVKA